MLPLETQQHLLDIFFTYVYPSYPIVDKYQFLNKFRKMSDIWLFRNLDANEIQESRSTYASAP